VLGIRQWFGNGFKSKNQIMEEKEAAFAAKNEKLQAWGEKPLKWDDYYSEPKPDEAKPEVKP
jgi:large subunit ribosomal protein L32